MQPWGSEAEATSVITSSFALLFTKDVKFIFDLDTSIVFLQVKNKVFNVNKPFNFCLFRQTFIALHCLNKAELLFYTEKKRTTFKYHKMT